MSSSDLEKCSIASLAHQWILCGEWVPSEWASKQLINTSEVIHTPPVHQLMSWEEKSYVPGKKSISCCVSHQNPHTFTTVLHCFLGLFWWIMDLYFSWKQQFTVKNVLMYLFLTNTQLLASQDVNWWTGSGTDYLWIIVMCLSAVLTAPIHRRGSTG